ncbi:MAG: serine/threonine protein kinase, partial [Planctomycetes bacterium]|nr:serine/threonine protein kinase [Planctomycetota bacterium]
MSNQTRDDPMVGRILAGQYKLLDQLGQGGMGAVYAALDTSLQRKVAIKIVRPDLGKNSEFVARFNREARLAARLRHSNAVTVYGFGESEGILYLAMEMAEGQELRAVIREAGHLPMARAKKILLQILDALNAAHSVGIVHRDLKPQNIIVGPQDLVKLLDFGVAKDPSEAALTQPGQVIGTVAYMAPEQVVAGPVDNRTDLYAVGCMLYQMLTGRLPFLANSAVEIMEMHRSTDTPEVRELRPELSPAVSDVIKRAMAKDPADRFQTAAEFAAAVKALAEPAQNQATVVQPTRPAGDTPVSVSYSTGATGAFYDGLEGRELGDYAIEAKLGEGGMGAVFRARDKVLGQLFALKVMHPALAQNAQVRERFKREARAALEFVHPNAIPTRACREAPGGLLYIVLDYSPGRSLRQILIDNGRLSVERSLGIVRQALLCLSEAHAKGIIHRDLKPENMMIEVDESGEDFVRVCDFGLAKLLDTPAGAEGEESLTGQQAIGTPHYMSPEQAGGEPIDNRTDLYALGAMLYELLTGSKMFHAESTLQILRAQITRVPTPVRERTPEAGIPPEVEAIVSQAISKEKDDRFQNADQFIHAIDSLGLDLPGRRNRTTSGRSGIAAAAGALETRAPTLVPGGGGTSPMAAVAVLGVLLLLLGGTAGLIYVASRGDDPVAQVDDPQGGTKTDPIVETPKTDPVVETPKTDPVVETPKTDP